MSLCISVSPGWNILMWFMVYFLMDGTDDNEKKSYFPSTLCCLGWLHIANVANVLFFLGSLLGLWWLRLALYYIPLCKSRSRGGAAAWMHPTYCSLLTPFLPLHPQQHVSSHSICLLLIWHCCWWWGGRRGSRSTAVLLQPGTGATIIGFFLPALSTWVFLASLETNAVQENLSTATVVPYGA